MYSYYIYFIFYIVSYFNHILIIFYIIYVSCHVIMCLILSNFALFIRIISEIEMHLCFQMSKGVLVPYITYLSAPILRFGIKNKNKIFYILRVSTYF